MQELNNTEKQSIKALNFIATFDGIIKSEDEIKYMLQKGIEKFVSKRRQHLCSITETAYPIRIKYYTFYPWQDQKTSMLNA